MKYHIAVGTVLGLVVLEQEVARGERPAHVISKIRDHLGATVHEPGGDKIYFRHKLLAKILSSTPTLWAYAERLVRTLGAEDIVYVSGEDVALPMGIFSKFCRDKPRVVLYTHNVDRPRARFGFNTLGARHNISGWLASSTMQVDAVRRCYHPPESAVQFLSAEIDTDFFCPGKSQNKGRPIIASSGLEQRDYRTMAEATTDLDLDVRVTGYSVDSISGQKAFPPKLPANMDARFYNWPDLRQLYCDASIVVVSLFENPCSAGVTTLMEGMACGRPVIVSCTEGLKSYIDEDLVISIPPGDVNRQREAIVSLLNDPERAAEMGRRGREYAQTYFCNDVFVKGVAAFLKDLP